MPLTKLNTDMDNIQKLENLTTDQAAYVKQQHDKAGNDIKSFINETLISELDTALSSKTNDLNTHKDSDDHDERYYTEAEVQSLLAEKTALTGDHQGTWRGLTPEYSEPGIAGVVASHTAQLADKANISALALKADKTEVDASLAVRATKDEVSVERARINSFTALAAGSTTGDAELIDARIGANGVNYANAGAALRGQISELYEGNLKQEAIRRTIISDKVLENFKSVNYAINYTSTFENDGKNIIAVMIPNASFTNHNCNVYHIDFYCKNVKAVRLGVGHTAAGNVITAYQAPINGKFEATVTSAFGQWDNFVIYIFCEVNGTSGSVSISDLTMTIDSYPMALSNDALFNMQGTFTKTVKDYNGLATKTNWSGKKWTIYGDSISDKDYAVAKHYYDKIASNTGITTTCLAVQGSGYMLDSQVTEAVAKWGSNNDILYQIDTYGAANLADIISIAAGVNDFMFSSANIGNINDAIEVFKGDITAPTSIYGAVAMAIKKIKAQNPYSTLFIMTPLPIFNLGNTYHSQTNSFGVKLGDYADCIKKVCEEFSVPCLDMYRISQLYSADQTNWLYDTIHPSELYHTTVYAKTVQKFIESLF